MHNIHNVIIYIYIYIHTYIYTYWTGRDSLTLALFLGASPPREPAPCGLPPCVIMVSAWGRFHGEVGAIRYLSVVSYHVSFSSALRVHRLCPSSRVGFRFRRPRSWHPSPILSAALPSLALDFAPPII